MRFPKWALFLATLAGASPQAQAVPGPFAVSLNNLRFSDGGVASGFFLVDSYGFISTPRQVDTTTGSILNGVSYAVGMPMNNTAQTFDFFLPDYSGGLHLELAAALDAGSPDPLVLGGVSYECANNCTTVRTLVSGEAVVVPGQNPIFIPPPGPIPEPASILLLATAAGLAAMVRRRRDA